MQARTMRKVSAPPVATAKTSKVARQGDSPLPHAFVSGSDIRSKSRHSAYPEPASAIAAAEPEGPAPTTIAFLFLLTAI